MWCAIEILEDGRYYAYAHRFKTGENLASWFRSQTNVIISHLCKSKKEAADIVEFWNDIHRQNGDYMFPGFCGE